MSKRLVIDAMRHPFFAEKMQNFFGDLQIVKTKKRKVTGVLKVDFIEGDVGWQWSSMEKEYIVADVFLIRNEEIIHRQYSYATFMTFMKDIISDLSWLTDMTEKNPNDWYRQVPSFFYSYLCETQQSFCSALEIDPDYCKYLSVGRYIYLRDYVKKSGGESGNQLSDRTWREIKNMPQMLSMHSPMVMRILFWHLASLSVSQEEVRGIVEMVEMTIFHKGWWSILGTAYDFSAEKAIVEKIIRRLNDPNDSAIFRIIQFYQDLPVMVTSCYGRKNKGKKTKEKFMETSVKSIPVVDFYNLLASKRRWGFYGKLKNFESKIETEMSVLEFTESDVTKEQIERSLSFLAKKWNFILTDPKQISEKSLLVSLSGKIYLCMTKITLREIQERVLMCLCAHPQFKRRFPVPISPWMTEKFFSGDPKDKEIVARVFYKLLHWSNKEGTNSLLATPDDTVLFSCYENLHKILNQFQDSSEIRNEFMSVFENYENLCFQKSKGQKETLVGIKNVSCLHRAIKSLLEIKAQHFLEAHGKEILVRYQKEIFDQKEIEPGPLDPSQTIYIYQICASGELTRYHAIRLFYSVYVEGQIMFPAKLCGIENWHRVSPFLESYKENMLQRTIEKNVKNQEDIPCRSMFYCFKMAEEMAHYQFKITHDQYKSSAEYRGNFTEQKINCDPRDFIVQECRCPLMLSYENAKSPPRTWFSTDLFPIYEGVICQGNLNGDLNSISNDLKNLPWHDFRLFDDAHPGMLEYLTT